MPDEVSQKCRSKFPSFESQPGRLIRMSQIAKGPSGDAGGHVDQIVAALARQRQQHDGVEGGDRPEAQQTERVPR